MTKPTSSSPKTRSTSNNAAVVMSFAVEKESQFGIYSLGSRCPPYVRFAAPSGLLTDIGRCPFSANSSLVIVLATDAIWRGAYRAPCTVFPKVISGLRKPIAIQAVISFNIMPE